VPETPPPGAEPLDPVPAPRVLLAGGGTAGHVNPLLATAAALRDPALGGREGAGILVLGTAEGLEAGLVPEAGFDMAVVPRVPMPRRPTGDLFMLPRRLSRAVGAAGEAIEAVDAQVVVGFGGYVSTPASLAARRAGVPVVIHEQNARPGMLRLVAAANRRSASCAAERSVTRSAALLL